MAERIGLVPGFTPDPSVSDPEDYMPWDFNSASKRARAEEMVRAKALMLLVVNPVCAAFSRLQRSSGMNMDSYEAKRLVEHGAVHLEFCICLCRIQREHGFRVRFENSHGHQLG